jgi:hypothetical protein
MKSTVGSAEATAPPLTIEFQGGFASEFGSEEAQLVLSLPWNLPTDVITFGPRTYSDLPSVLEQLKRTRRTLHRGEYVWSNVTRKTIESNVRPEWRPRRRSAEFVEVVRHRLLERWQVMEGLRMSAT